MLRTSTRILVTAAFFLSILTTPTFAQDNPPLPSYVVQQGDTLFTISLKFNISTEDIIQTNQLANPDLLSAGMELKIPGLSGIQGRLISKPVPLGQNLTSLSRYYQITPSTISRLNHLTSPAEVYAGANLIIPEDTLAKMKAASPLSETQSLLELSASHTANPWQISKTNLEENPIDLLPGDSIFLPASEEEADLGNPLKPYVNDLELAPLPLIQGSTAVIRLSAGMPLELEGSLNNKPLHFFANGANAYVAIQGIHAMSEPGLANFSINITLPDGQTRQMNQMVLLRDGFYFQDPPLSVDPVTIDPANTKPEEDLIAAAIALTTPNKLWNDIFKLPVDEPACTKSLYGNRRSYNGGPYSFFHTGLDYGVCANLNIRAPAPGIVVFAGPLTVRGNATLINHGWGIYTGYWHQSEILVSVGDKVETGQVIGSIGGTGRVTGPHLHFEIWANGIQVNPQEWLDRPVP